MKLLLIANKLRYFSICMKRLICILYLGFWACINTFAQEYISETNNLYIKNNTAMREILDSISVQMIKLKDLDYTETQIKSKWFGNIPATIDDIKKTEDRLKIILPQDYKDFLLTTNGFHAFSQIDPGFCSIDKVDFLKNIDPDLIRIWNQHGNVEIGKLLEKSIIIAGINEEQSFLIIPPDSDNDKCLYWKFAAWIPGEERFDDLMHYFSDALNFLKNEIPDDK